MYRGKIVAIIPAEEVTKEQVGLLMAGVSYEQAMQQAPAAEPRKRETTL